MHSKKGLQKYQPSYEGIVSILFVFQLILGVLQLMDVLEVTYFPTIHRMTRTRVFDLGFSLSVPLALMQIIWLGLLARRVKLSFLALPFLSVLIIPLIGYDGALGIVALAAMVVGLWRLGIFTDFFLGLLCVLTGFKIVALIHWVLMIPFGLTGPLKKIAMLELDLFFILAYILPLLVLPFLFMWALKLIMRMGMIFTPSLNITKINFKFDRFLLFFSLVISIVAAVYPWNGNINPQGVNVGVDIHQYLKAVNIIKNDIGEAFFVWAGERPILFLLIFLFQKIFDVSLLSSIKFLPIVLNPLLVLSVYFLASEIYNNTGIARWSAFFTASGIKITIGMYAYFLANMLGLVFLFISLGLLFRAIRLKCYQILGLAGFFGGLLVYTHPWTMDQYIFPLGLVTLLILYNVYRKKEERYTSLMLIVYLSIIGLFELSKNLIFHGVGGFQAANTPINAFAGIGEFWSASIFSFRFLFGGLLSSLVPLFFAVIGIYYLGKDVPSQYFRVLVFASSVVYLIGDDGIKSRILYNLPIGMFAAIGLLIFLNFESIKKYQPFVIFFVLINELVYLFRSLANLI